MNNDRGKYLTSLTGPVSLFWAFPYALQHVLTMFVSNLSPILLIIAACVPAVSEQETVIIIQNAMIAAGIATFIQATPISKLGSGLPIFMGVSFTFVLPLSAVASKFGYGAVIGTVIAGGIFEGLLGLTAKYWKKIISPIISAVVVTGIGISLLATVGRSFGGGYAEDFGSFSNLFIGNVTVAVIIGWQIWAKGHRKQLAILAGLTAGYLTALLFGKVDLSHLLDSGWFALPKLLPYMPEFHLNAILSLCVIYLVSACETIGDATAVASGALHREITPNEISGALTADGFGSMIAGLFGVSAVTSYSENIGLTIMTGVVNRTVIRVGAVIIMLCGLFPPIGQFMRTIPESVIGGILLIVFGQIVVSGFEMIADAGFTARNKLIAALSISSGIGFSASSEAGLWDTFPAAVQSIFSQNVVSIIFVTALFLDLLLPKEIRE